MPDAYSHWTVLRAVGLARAAELLLTGKTFSGDELERQRTQAELDLARFDQQYGGQLNLGEQAFTMPSEPTGNISETLAVLQDLVIATQMVATNTAPRTTGPSMEAGLQS